MKVLIKNKKGEVIAEKDLPFEPYKHPTDVEREQREDNYKRAMDVLWHQR